jgi:hypothetical protein
MRQIKVKVIYEIYFPADPANYDGETDIQEMINIEKRQFEDGSLLMDLIMNEKPEVEVTVA